MGFRQVVLDLPEELIAEAERIAEESDTSVSAFVAEWIGLGVMHASESERLRGDYRALQSQRKKADEEARRHAAELMETGIDFGSPVRDWKREDIYEERMRRLGVG